MADVADAAGVHQTTVSLVFRRHPSIPKATQERLLKLAKEMGYRPNPLVSALMGQIRHKQSRKGGGTLAYITNNPPENPWQQYDALREMFTGAEEKALELGFRLQEFAFRPEEMSAKRFMSILTARGIRGLIIAPLTDGQSELALDLSEFAAVALGLSVKDPLLERIANDHFHSMQLAFNQCLQYGYRRIGFLVGREFLERLEGLWMGAYLYERDKLPVRRRLKPLLLEAHDLHPKRRMNALVNWAAKEKPDAVISPLGAAQNEWLPMFASLPTAPGVVNLTLPSNPQMCAGILQGARQLGAIAVERLVSRLYHNLYGSLAQIQNTTLHGTWHNGSSLPSLR